MKVGNKTLGRKFFHLFFDLRLGKGYVKIDISDFIF